MHYAHCAANDGCKLAFQSSLPLAGAASATQCVLLMHGFSGSSDYFRRNFDALAAAGLWVVAPDMRGHGRSDRTRGGYHVARLAADLRDLIAELRRAAPGARFVPVGCSIGAAVLWTYVELFGCADFAGLVFVDQAPLQDRSSFDGWDESRAHAGCYDEKTTLAAQRFWMGDPAAAHVDLVDGCLGYRAKPDPADDVPAEKRREDEAFFTGISALCDPAWLARLLADHTRYDHREAIEAISVPTLVMAGRRSGCFPLEGMLETVRRVEKARPGLAKASVFESGHWLFYEQPERFNSEIVEFVGQCSK
ncbi:Alpha/Beta hydrolase protein [Colletotrichum navitas]|uniref:Alpha/Beta hydrolase protein n=1 Tax=Colletotrichum navitas TaxID=681940 RepID=A0AAD8Q358_9PEZI|nr:Alpha/Beta hydrolase protein [Colletotrichum navitas]KAK1595087.1 Alpha/Beta hydrolase protein [Colletotrichum navitas]